MAHKMMIVGTYIFRIIIGKQRFLTVLMMIIDEGGLEYLVIPEEE